LTIVCSFIVFANSHAILRVPIPYVTIPSKTSPCAGGVTSTLASVAWQTGTKVNVTWQVVAADGVGTVSVNFDTAGGQTFVAGNAVQIGNAPAIAFYNFTFTVPALTCPNGLCTAQFASSSAWFSCTSVQLTTVVPPPINTSPVCAQVNNLNYCSQLNGQAVLVPYGQTAASTDANAASTFTSTLYNPNVFTTPNATGCAAAYQNFLCHNGLPYCGGAAFACQTVCNTALQLCGISASHIGLYNCAAGPLGCCQNGTVCQQTNSANPTGYTIPNVYSGPLATSAVPAKIGSASSVAFSMLLLLCALWML